MHPTIHSPHLVTALHRPFKGHARHSTGDAGDVVKGSLRKVRKQEGGGVVVGVVVGGVAVVGFVIVVVVGGLFQMLLFQLSGLILNG